MDHFTGVIQSFRHKRLEELFEQAKTRRIGADRTRKCLRILQLVNQASKPEDLDIAAYRLHKLHGVPSRWSMRLTANERITFGWCDEGAIDLDVEDYH